MPFLISFGINALLEGIDADPATHGGERRLRGERQQDRTLGARELRGRAVVQAEDAEAVGGDHEFVEDRRDGHSVLAGLLALSVIMTWLFNASRGSILVAWLMHFQAMNPLFPDAQPWDNLVEETSMGRLLPGEGASDSAAVFLALHSAGVDVTYNVEVFSAELMALPAGEAAGRLSRSVRAVISAASKTWPISSNYIN